MKNLVKNILILILGFLGILLIYIIAKDAFIPKTTVFSDGISYYNDRKYAAAEQLLQSEAEKGNQEAYPYLGHTKLVLGKPKEAEKYLLLSLEHLKKDDFASKKNVLFNLGSVYINLKEYPKAKFYLMEAVKLGNEEAERVLIRYNLH